MKFSLETFISVLLALVVYSVLNKLFLEKTLDGVFNWEQETYED